GARLRIDADPLHHAEVDDDAAVAERESREAVPAAPDRDRQVRVTGEPNGSDDVGHACASRDDCRKTVDRPVPDLAVLLVGWIGGTDHLPPEGTPELSKRGFVQLSLGDGGAQPIASRPAPWARLAHRPVEGASPATH